MKTQKSTVKVTNSTGEVMVVTKPLTWTVDAQGIVTLIKSK